MNAFFFLLLLQSLRLASPALYPLRDTARPGVGSLPWWEGGPAFALASSSAVRLNFRGLYTYPPKKATMRELGSGWHGVVCNASAFALCGSDVGQVLPAISPRVSEHPQKITADGWKDLACTDSSGKLLVSLGVYDISACDVFDEGLDLVFANSTLYHRHNTLDTWEYWVLVALSIVLVRFLSHNIKVLWDPASEPGDSRQQQPALLCAALVVIVVVLLDGDSHFITTGDQAFFWATALYIALYLAVHVTGRSGFAQPVYNILVATLQLVACRFYASAETPYNLVLLGVLAARTWHKLLVSAGGNATVLLDSLYLSLCIELAFDGTRELLVAVLGVAYVGGSLLARR
jgi:hypothetical protein